ncbi:response regulator [Kovacikia minuta CCNUW1]|uniref:response regulator n=1 Tax=Kovacikia minuta TaxID=2931930 RepID=UPI001CC9CD8D|nr:response regulator [Kovacikia minuta]UBF27937.1 response regulator [Kovacikia minuta CCNUW1]
MVNDGRSVSKPVKGISADLLAVQFQVAAKSHFSGKFDFSADDGRQWSLYFRLGRLIWAASSEHRFRRWYRLLKQFCPTIHPQSIKIREKDFPFYWEYLVLSVLFKRQHISREQAIALIQTVAIEVLFDLLYTGEQITASGYVYDKQEEFSDPLAPFNAEQLLGQVQQDLNNWYNAGLIHYSPHAVPVIKRPDDLQRSISAKTYQTLKTLIDGNSTLRDLARATGQNLLSLTRALSPHFQRDLIGLNKVPDFPVPSDVGTPTAPVTIADPNAPLIVCIDDSPQVCKSMERIIQSAGYRYLSIEDSVHALPLLLEKKPNLIFLDLVMPIASGYEICAQIRRISVFKTIPIVILTGKDGIVDRVRAKVVGASGFLAKPVDPPKVLAIAQQYLPITPPATVSVPTDNLVSQPESSAERYDMGETTALLIQQSLNNISTSL